ncbi:MAG: TetR family transcriptional regulator [Alphaproteobacteria bacterium]|nr:TetR family transcriptional regulator [Alphaproteobacteria bacterium]MCD8525708.1 TetR family transcriptional regulator [Alphaproteobacteria bacterium]MCD8570697.1 TetR family transcriptional regulator [Alphaproteobacteria bacterium]
MPAKTDLKAAVILSALKQAAEIGWAHVSLKDIADGANISLAEMHDHFEDKFDILAGIERMIDKQVLANLSGFSPEDSERDRLFDILMDRFEVLNEHRAGLTSILQSMTLDPKQAVIALPHLCRSMCWMLESAGISTYGVKGALKVAGLAGIYAKTLRVWVKDDSPDLAKVMAALDKDLGRVENWAGSLGL